MLCNGHRNARDIDLLKAVSPDEAGADVACDRHHGDAVHICRGDARDKVCRTRATRCQNHTCFSCGAGVAVGRVCGPLFVSRHYVAYLDAVLVERIIQIQYRTAGIAKQRLDALFHQNFCKNVRACQYHTCALLLPSFSL